MCCGVKLNSYHTTKYIRFILPDGNIFSTENSDDYKRFEEKCSAICNELRAIKKKFLPMLHYMKGSEKNISPKILSAIHSMH
jgi:hypothetical protein